MLDDEGDDGDVLRRGFLAAVTMHHRTAEAAIANRLSAIENARRLGATWQQIADALGLTRQAAHKRFGRAVDGLGGHGVP